MISSFAPSAALAPFVEGYVVYDFPPAMRNGVPAALTVFPDTRPFACFIFGDALQATHKHHHVEHTRSGIGGFQTYRVDMQGAGHMRGVSVRFTPWGASCLMPAPADDMVDVRVAFRDMFRAREIEALEDELSALTDARARAHRVDSFLLQQVQPSRLDELVRAAAICLVQARGTLAARTLAHQFGLSERSLERRFLAATGVGPKKFARVVRLQSALAGYQRTYSWTDTAAATGYCDQSHLIRDCQAMLGMSPEVLVGTPLSEAAQAFQTAVPAALRPARMYL